jgi:hypothetical protein
LTTTQVPSNPQNAKYASVNVIRNIIFKSRLVLHLLSHLVAVTLDFCVVVKA